MSAWPDELRCCRSDSKNWRCARARIHSSKYCEHHRDLIQKNYENSKRKKESLPDVEIGITSQPDVEIGITSLPDVEIGITSLPDVEIGITKQCLSNKYKIKEPEIAETISLPGDILALGNLTDVLNVLTWREHLTDAEKNRLYEFLPDLEEMDKTSIAESLLNGEDLNFGNPAMKWGESVCRGEQHPDVLLEKEWELKLSQKQYFKNLKAYKEAGIASCEELKQVCVSLDEDDAKFRDEVKKRRGKRLWNEVE